LTAVATPARRNEIQNIDLKGPVDRGLKAAFGLIPPLAALDWLAQMEANMKSDNREVRDPSSIDPVKLHCGDALSVLKKLRDQLANCIVTSPPYWSQKVYAGGPGLGNEATVDEYLANLTAIFIECHRVLRDEGSLWVVISDSWHKKALQQVPQRLALLLAGHGWILRQDIIWSKAGQGLSSARDRVRNTHEHILHFVKRRKYFFNHVALRVPYADGMQLPNADRYRQKIKQTANITTAEKAAALADLERRVLERRDYRVRLRGQKAAHRNHPNPGARERGLEKDGFYFYDYHPDGAMLSSVWEIPSTTDDIHPCPFPAEIVRRLIDATCPVGGVVLDPFLGSGTTAVVARSLGRRVIGIDVSSTYVARTRARLRRAHGARRSSDQRKVRKTRSAARRRLSSVKKSLRGAA
jgi:site-specific DNA-methyltransferase (adenine-specific)